MRHLGRLAVFAFTSTAVVLAVGLDWAAPVTARAQAVISGGQSCSQMISKIDRDLGAFQKGMRDDTIDFIKSDALDAAGDAVSPIIDSSPTLAGAAKAQEYIDVLQRWRDTCSRYRTTFEDLESCVNTKGCSLLDLAKRQNQALKEWLDGIVSDNSPASLERVRKASSLLRNYTTQLEGNLEGGVNGALSCLKDYQQRANYNNPDPVDLRPPPPATPAPAPVPAPAPKSGGGASVGKLVGVTLAGAAAVVGGVVLAKEIDKQLNDCSSQETAAMNGMTSTQNAVNNLVACGASTSCYDSRVGTFNSAWSSWANALGNWCNCLGVSVPVSSTEKTAIQQLWASVRSIGLNPGTMPSCFQ
jgi:hypothetical protein